MDSTQLSLESRDLKTERLRLRRALFRGAAVHTPPPLPRNSNSSGFVLQRNDSDDDLSNGPQPSDRNFFSLSVRKRRPAVKSERSREASKPNPRRQRTLSPVSVEDNMGWQHDEEEHSNFSGSSASAAAGHTISQSNSSRPLDRYHKRAHSRAHMAARTSSCESARYIEHLESQLVAVQTQLQLLTSPSTNKRQYAKLRALNDENVMLQQEVGEWESKFADRLRDQTDHQNMMAEHLRSRIAMLEQENVGKEQALREMENTLQIRQHTIDVAEQANFEMERRLELMSSLVATSPGKLDLYMPPDPVRGRGQHALQPFKRLSGQLISPSHSVIPAKPTTIEDVTNTTPTFQGPYRAATWDENRFEVASRDSGYSTDLTNDTSGSTPHAATLLDAAISPSRRRSTFDNPAKGERAKPARRMRRFHAGSARQSLILPSTSSASESQPTSTSDIQSTLLSPCFAPTSSTAGFNTSTCPLLKQTRVLPLTPRHYHSRNSTTSQIVANDDMTNTSHPASAHLLGRDSGISERSISDIEMSLPYSTGRNEGRNLFDELAQIKQERDRRDTSIDSTATFIAATDKSHTTIADHPYHSTKTANSRSSTFTDPAEEPEIDAVYEDESVATRTASVRGSASPNLPLPTWTMRDVLLHPLTLRLPLYTAHRLIHFTWNTFSLSRPVIEFRLWLVRLLLGRLHVRQRKNGDLLLRQRQRHVTVGSAVNISRTASGLGLGAAGMRSRSGSVTTCGQDENQCRGHSANKTPNAQRIRKPLVQTGPLKLSLECGADSPDLEDFHDEFGVAAEELHHTGQPPASSNALSHPFTVGETKYKHETPPAISWLKLSMTMVAAVGMALMDGPGSLLDGCGEECTRCNVQ